MWVSLTSSRVCSFTHLFTHLSIPQIFIDPLARCSRMHGGTYAYTHTYGYLRLNREGRTYSRCPPSGFNSSGDSESGACSVCGVCGHLRACVCRHVLSEEELRLSHTESAHTCVDVSVCAGGAERRLRPPGGEGSGGD